MNKIVIEVTSDGWETTVTINGKEYYTLSLHDALPI